VRCDLSILALVIVPLVAVAAVTLPFTFTNGTVADADEVNANFNALASQMGSEVFRGQIAAMSSSQWGTVSILWMP
jgi:hypothetical protein